MAKTNRPAATRRNTNNMRNSRAMYVEGNTARRLQEVPDRHYQTPQERQKRRKPEKKQAVQVRKQNRQVSSAAQRNREKAMGMSRSFVVFLAVVCTAVLFFCVNYLQLKSEITAKMKTVATLEAELTQLKEDNDAYYSQVSSNVDLNRIKKIAIGRLGMKYPTDDQKMTYTTSRSSYVRQYQDVPETTR